MEPGPMNNQDVIFDFERDFAGALRCIPMAVRFKLDHIGIKLSLRQWSRFSHAERAALLQAPCGSLVESTAYRTQLRQLVGRDAGNTLQELPLEAAPEWIDCSRIPSQIVAYVGSLGLVPLDVALWAGLAPLQRFTLLKLSRDHHDNVNFIPALHEFGMQQAWSRTG